MKGLCLFCHFCYLFFKMLQTEICKLGRNLPLSTFGSERVNTDFFYVSASTGFNFDCNKNISNQWLKTCNCCSFPNTFVFLSCNMWMSFELFTPWKWIFRMWIKLHQLNTSQKLFYLVALIVFHFVNFIYYSRKILSLGIGLFLEYIMDNFIKKIDGKQ